MKRLLYTLLLATTVMALYGCEDDPANTTTASKNETVKINNHTESAAASLKKTGNTPGNILSGGYLAEDNGWIYHSIFDGSDCFYKERTDGSEKQKLDDQDVCDINVNGEWIYYSVVSKGIYKIKTDGSSKELIRSFKISPNNLIYYDGCLYFTEDLIPYKISLDTNKISHISDQRFQDMVIIDNWIYYISYNKNKLKRCTIDGTDFQTLSPHSVDAYTIKDGNIYFQDGDDYCLYRMTMDGSNITKLKDDFVADSMHIIDGTLYYLAIGTQICSLDLDTLKSKVYRKTNDVIDLSITEHSLYYRYVKNRGTDSEDVVNKFEIVKKD